MAKIGYDMDGVLVDLMSHLLELNNKETGDNITRDSITKWNLDKIASNGKEIYKHFSSKGFFINSPAIKDSIKYFKKLSKENNFMFIITAVPHSSQYAYNEKVEWIKKYLPFFDLDNLIITHSKQICTELDFIIDDNETTLAMMSITKTHAICFDQPWNRHVHVPGVWRVFNHEQLYNHINSFNNNL